MKTSVLTLLSLFSAGLVFSQTLNKTGRELASDSRLSQKTSNEIPVELKSEKYPAGFEKEESFMALYRQEGPLYGFDQSAEILDRRDAFSKHYRVADGEAVAVITSGPQHYEKNGLWHTILNKVHYTHLPSYPYGNEYNAHFTYFGNQQSALYKMVKDGSALLTGSYPTLVFTDANGVIVKEIALTNFNQAQIKNEKIFYKNAAPGIHIEFIHHASGFKYNFILESPAALGQIPTSANFVGIKEKFSAGSGFTVQESGENGFVTFVKGEQKIKISNFSIYDGKDTPDLTRAKNVSYQNGELSYVVALEWITDPMRSYPVTIDPTLTYYPNASIYWTGTVEEDSGCDFGTDNDSDENIRVGFDDGTIDNDYYNGYAKFNITSIPDNACIQNSYARFYQYNFRNTEAGGKCWGNDDQLQFYVKSLNPATTDPVLASCDAIRIAMETSSNIFATYNVFSGYTPGVNNGWKNLANGLNALVSGTLIQNHFSIGLDQFGSHSDPGFKTCCFCTPDNDDWLDFRGWNNANRPQAIITYQTPYIIGSIANVSANNVCAGTSVTLSLTGGTTGSDGAWYWYSGSCGGTLVGTSTAANAALTISAPTTTTTYYVRGQGSCGNTTCQSVTLNILANSVAATSISETNDSLCLGGSVTLSVAGGSLGAGANWQWFSGSCGGTPAGTGSAINVSPIATTTYYVRAAGTCNTTACVSQTIVVSTPSVPGFLTASNTTPCFGSGFTVSLAGHSGSVLHWERQFNGGGYANIANAGNTTVSQTGLAVGTYEYRAYIKNGVCAGVYSNTISVQVIPQSFGGSTYAFNPSLCEGNGTLVTLSGEVGNILYWELDVNGGGFAFAGNGGSNNFATGPLLPGTYTYRAVVQSGSCASATSTVSTVVVSPNTVAGNVNILPDTICLGTPLTVNLNGNVGNVMQWERDINSSGYLNIGGAGLNPLLITPNTPGLHTYRAIVQSGVCASNVSVSDQVYVRPNGDASISYNAASYCNNASSNPLPLIQTPGGSFSASPATLTFVSTSTGEIDLANSAPGTYTISYQLPAQYCNATGTAIVTINAGTNANLTYFSSAYCSADLNPLPVVAPTGGVFSASPGGLVFNGTNGEINLASSNPGSYTISYQTGGLCPSSAMQTITINASPTPSINGPSIFCNNGAITQINATPAGGLFMGGAFITGGGQFDPSIAGPGVHMLVYQYTSPQGCIGYATTNVQVNTAPVISMGSNSTLCDNGSATLLNALPLGGSWNGPFTSTAGVFDPAQSGAGSFQIFYSITDANNCTSIDSTTVNVNASPNAAINPQPIICAGSSPVLLSGINPGGTWSGGPYISAVGSFDPAITGAGQFPVTHTLVSGTCSSSTTQNILVSASPNPTLTPVNPLCTSDTPIQLTAVTPGGTFSGGAYVTATGIFDPAIAGAGTHMVQYNVNLGSCSAFSNMAILVNAAPTPSIAPTLSFCSADPVQNLAATPAGGVYSGNPFVTINGLFYPTLSGAGTFPVIYTVSNGAGCSATVQSSIIVNSSPDASFSVPSTPLCSSDGIIALNPVSPGGTWSGGPYISPTGLFDPAIAGPGLHPVTYSVSLSGCSDSYSTTIAVNAAPNVSILSPTQACLNDGTNLLFANIPGGVWTGNSGYISAAGLFDPIIAGVGSHLVVYTVYGGNGCAGFDSTFIQVNPNPDATINYPGVLCEGSGIYTLSAATPGGTWGGGPYVNNNLFDPAVSGVGSHWVTYTVSSAQNCSSSSGITITVDPLPVAGFNNQNNGLLSYFSDYSLHADSWTWDFGDGSAIDTTQNPMHQFPDNGSYFVRLIVSNACGSDTIIRTIYVNKALSNNEYDQSSAFLIYPNPAVDDIHISFTHAEMGILYLDIIDMSGKTVYKGEQNKQTEKGEWTLNTSHFAPGVYALRGHINGKSISSRFIIQKQN